MLVCAYTNINVNEVIVKTVSCLEDTDLKPKQKGVLKAFVGGRDAFWHFQPVKLFSNALLSQVSDTNRELPRKC